MAVLPSNEALDIILHLLSQKRMPMVASPELAEMLGPYARDQLGMTTGMPIDMTNVLDPNDVLGPYNRTGVTAAPPPISRDPWFDDLGIPEKPGSFASTGWAPSIGPEDTDKFFVFASDQTGARGANPLDGPFTNESEAQRALEEIAKSGRWPRGQLSVSKPPQNTADDLFTFMDRHERNPWFDQLEQGGNPEGWPPGTEAFSEDMSPGSPAWSQQRTTLVGDMMRALGIEGNGSRDRYMSQLQEVNDAFIMRIAQKLGLNADGQPNIARVLIANEFEHFGPRLPR